MKNFKITAVVVTHNGLKNNWIDQCITSLYNQDFEVNVIVVDNNSEDETVAFIKSHFKSVEVVEAIENYGFAKANNIGISRALQLDFDYLLLINQDAWLKPNALKRLIEASTKSIDFGILSPVHLNGSGNLIDTAYHSYLSRKEKEERLFVTDAIMGSFTKNVYEFNFLNAACWLLPKTTIKKVGVFDNKNFPHYGEDNDYIIRMQHENLKIGVVPKAYMHHDRENREKNKKNSDFEYNAKEIELKLVQKHFPSKRPNLLYLESLRILHYLVSFQFRKALVKSKTLLKSFI